MRIAGFLINNPDAALFGTTHRGVLLTSLQAKTAPFRSPKFLRKEPSLFEEPIYLVQLNVLNFTKFPKYSESTLTLKRLEVALSAAAERFSVANAELRHSA